MDWYETIGPEELSFALERTVQTIQARALYLRKLGLMSKPSKNRRNKKRLNREAI